MKKLSIIILSILIISCKKETETKINFNGRWTIDTARYIDVMQLNDSLVDITFPRKIDTPPEYQGPIKILYKMVVRNDTAYCISRNIYPGCFFINRKTFYTGYIAEWTQGAELGTIKEMTK